MMTETIIKSYGINKSDVHNKQTSDFEHERQGLF